MEGKIANTKLDFLSGGGEMGERIRNFDWSKSPLGSTDTWSQSLQSTISIVLANRFPMLLWWGPQYISLYNDAYAPILGVKHPNALSVPANECWDEIWDVLQPLLDTPFYGGSSTWIEDFQMLINRKGFLEESHFTVSYSPVPDKTVPGGIGGVLASVHEITEKVIHERALSTLRQIGAINFEEKSLDIIYRNVADALAHNNKDFPFALVYKITGDANTVTLAASTGIDKSQNVFPDTIDVIKPTAITKDFCEAFRENKMVVSEIKAEDITPPTGAWETTPKQFIHLPVSVAGGKHPYCIISAALNPYRQFDDTYRQFCQLIGDRVSIEINKMLAVEVERKEVLTSSVKDLKARINTQIKISRKKDTALQDLYSLFDELPFAVAALTGEELCIEFINKYNLNVWQQKKEDVIGKPLFEVRPDIKESAEHIHKEINKTGKRFTANEIPIVINNNDKTEARYFNAIIDPMFDEAGKVVGQLATSIDVTEQVLAIKKIKENEMQLQSIFFNAPAAIAVITGPQHTYVLANTDYQKMVSRTSEQLVGKTSKAIFPELVGTGTFEIFDGIYQTGESFFLAEYPVKLDKNNDGNVQQMYFRFSAVPLKDAEGKFDSIVIVAIDITEQVLAREKIEQSEKKFQAAILAVEGIIWTNNANGEMNGEQPGWANLTGQRFEEYQGYGWANAVHPDDAQPTVEAWNKAVANRSTFEFEHRVKTKHNEWRLFSIKAVPVFDEKGIIQQWVGVHTDITDQKLAEEKLAYRTALLEAHNEANVDGILLVDAKGKILSFNQRFVEIWNMPPNIVNSKDDEAALLFAMTQLVNPQQFIDKVKYLYEHPTETSLDELEFKDGKIIERYGYPVIGEGGAYYAWSWTFKDITQKIKIAQDLKNTKEQLELTFKNIPAGVYLLNHKGEMIYVNDKGAAVYGDFTPEDLLAEKDLPNLLKIADELFERYDDNGNHFTPNDSPAYISLTTGLPSQAVLMQINKVTKEKRWHYVQGAPLFNEEGKIYMVLVTSTDITIQKNAEQKTKESEKQFSTLANNIQNFAWIADGDGWVYWYNQRWYDYTGTTLEEMKGWGWQKVHHPDHVERILEISKKLWITNEPFELTFPLRRYDGEYRWFLTRGVPISDENGKVISWIGTNTDIEEQKTFSEQLEVKVNERTLQLNEVNLHLEQKNIELQKMNKELEAFTYISSHDLQEPLRKIQTFAGRIIATEKEHLSDTAKDYFGRMQDSATRMQALIQDLLAFSRLSTSERKFVKTDLSKIVDEVKAEFKEAIEEKNASIIAVEMCEANIIPFQFHQLMHNLIGNALKFSKQDVPPRIIINSEHITDSNSPFANRGACHVSVSDNGIGFEKHFSERIFGVFQRLHGKDEYTGTGIGLAIVKKIVENHNGMITAESELGKGATFNIYFPD